jgi:DNA-binding CsgD family transcriptional regulator
VFRQAGPVVFEDTLDNPHIEPELARFFQQVGTRSKMAIAIRDGGQIVGLLCLDHSRPQAWDLESRSRVQVLASLVIGPVLGAARNLTVATPHEAPEATTASPLGWEASSIERLGLTPAECRVAQWVMQGYSYKEVARHLNRSASTIDHQLRSLRQKLGVTSTAKLVQALHQLPVPPR